MVLSNKIKLLALSLIVLLMGYGVGKFTNRSSINALNTVKNKEIIELENRLDSQLAQIDQLEKKLSGMSEQELAKSHSIDSHQSTNNVTETTDNAASADSELITDSDTPEQIAAEAVEPEVAMSDINQLLLEAKTQSLSGDGISESTHDRLMQLVATDPISQERVLQAFLMDPISKGGESLRRILGDFRDENIEAAAVEMTASINETEIRLAGLELLQQMGIENSETLDVALAIVIEESDTQLVNSALDTLQFQTVSPAQNSEIRETIRPRLSDADAEVRRRSIIAYSDWVTNPEAALPIIEALDDPSVDVRAGAAYAMSKVSAKSIDIRDALVRKVDDETEDWLVREQAWHALGQHDMDDISHEVYAEFKSERDARGESVK